MMLVIYLSSLIRSVIALHNLINNKVSFSILNLKYYLSLLILALYLGFIITLYLEFITAIYEF